MDEDGMCVGAVAFHAGSKVRHKTKKSVESGPKALRTVTFVSELCRVRLCTLTLGGTATGDSPSECKEPDTGCKHDKLVGFAV